jgi:ATP-dependent Lon protease
MLFRNDKDKNDKKDGRNGQGDTVPLLPLRELIVFPHQVYPIFVGRQKSIKALEAAEARKQPILLVAQKDAKVSDPGPQDIYATGTLGVVVQLLRLPDGTVKALLEGKRRARIIRYAAEDEYFQVEVEPIEEIYDRTTELEALIRSVNATFDNYVRLNKKIPPEMVTSIAAVDDPAYLADKLVEHLGIKLEDKQALLECANPAERLEKILSYMRSELEILEVEKRIRSRVKKQMEKTQKEYYLNEQMRAIQKELGEKDEFKNEIQELEEKLRQKKMPAEAREKCEREIKKLKMMSPMSAEATVVRNYLDWFLALPWFEYTEDKLDIKEAERVLEEDHYGLEKVKQRILEYLAVQTLVGQMKGPILCLVGPPGVGKTSLGKSIARATGRKFVRVSLGGVRDEAEVRGHRRTYIGALPGKIIQSMRKANGLREENIEFSDQAILQVIRLYTREAGVRNLEREIASICRKVAVEVVKTDRNAHVRVSASSLAKQLGPPRFRYGMAETEPQVGVATGLAWTEMGGELLGVEVTIVPGRGKLTVTGQLGEVMQESAQAAMSYIRSRADALGLASNFYQKIDIHIHIPEGATPKDGPSAGITLATALASALCRVPVRNDLAMTGEITLRGRVLPIGGLKEKILAAHRGGVKIVLMPKENAKDVDDIPAPILKNVTLIQVEHMDQVLRHALVLADPDTFFKSKPAAIDYAAESKEELVDDETEDEPTLPPSPTNLS